jgi:polyisoprenoid-binding protein YceI
LSIQTGTFKLGPENGTLSVKTGRDGAAAKAGHDLVIHVTAWEATLEVGAEGEQSSLVLSVDATSLQVREGTGGIKSLDEDDKANIRTTIDTDVLKGQAIEFRSTQVDAGAGGRMAIQGDLTLAGKTHPIAFDVTVGDDGALTGAAVVRQSDWGIKPYSALFGALKVSDEVEVAFQSR